MGINRKLLLLNEVYGIYTYSEILIELEELKNHKTDFDDILKEAQRFKIFVDEAELDSTEIDNKIREIEIQILYIGKNIDTLLDALSLCEEEVVHNVFLPNNNAWVEVCDN